MQNSRLATRVSTGTACERCRRLKQRCEPIRPCSNCVNAKQECVVTLYSKPKKRARTTTRDSTPVDDSAQSSTTPPPTMHTDEPRSANHRESFGRTSSTFSIFSQTEQSLQRESSMVAEFGNSESAMEITRRVLQSNRSPEARATFAIPGGDFQARRDSVQTYHSVSDLIGVELPPKFVADALLEVYFYKVHWFSLVVYEPNFRNRYQDIITTGVAKFSDRAFLLLLLMVLVMSCHYSLGVAHEPLQQTDLDDYRARYLKVVRQNLMDLLDEENIEFVQICILLGSYWLYWGKPRSAFTLLGAATKSAQALSLHRQGNGGYYSNKQQSLEERKRVWWTIYTWDRFATIVYGRPLGINDRDCDVPMPAIFAEHVMDLQTAEEADVELSPYQTNLNKVYRIASPMLENIYRIRGSGDATPLEKAHMVDTIDQAMHEWCNHLPENLDLDQSADLSAQSSLRLKLHQLQALSLRLTYLNLMIIIHRPLLVDWRHQRKQSPGASGTEADADQETYEKSFERCLSAALAIARLGQSKPNLVSLASKSHLLSFLAMNIFTSSVVLFICASSDILSNAAQEAKRGMSRNLKLLKSLPNAGSLSKQCSVIVGDLINIILEKEKEEMLLGPVESDVGTEPPQSQHGHPYGISFETARNSAALQNPSFHPRDTSVPPLNFLDGNLAGTEATFGRTMEQLHRVLKDATHPRGQQQLEGFVDQEVHSSQNRPLPAFGQTWSNETPWTQEEDFEPNAFAPPFEPDMTQFWLWDFESTMGYDR